MCKNQLNLMNSPLVPTNRPTFHNPDETPISSALKNYNWIQSYLKVGDFIILIKRKKRLKWITILD